MHRSCVDSIASRFNSIDWNTVTCALEIKNTGLDKTIRNVCTVCLTINDVSHSFFEDALRLRP